MQERNSAEDKLGGSMRVRASVYVLVAFDVGQGIDLDLAETRLASAQRQGLGDLGVGKRTPAYLDYRPLPVRVSGSAERVEVCGTGEGGGGKGEGTKAHGQDARATEVPRWATEGTFDAVIFDFGAVSVTQRIGFEGTLEELLELSDALYEHAPLIGEAENVVRTVVDAIREAISRPFVSDVLECYVVIQLDDARIAEMAKRRDRGSDGLIAGILRSERMRLSEEEVADAMAARISYGERDAVLIDWNAAIIVDPGEVLPGAPGAGRGGDDVRFVLEYANVELLEMRVLDDRLDQILDDSYRIVAERRSRLRGGSREMDRIARLQMDSALLYEGVNNAIKLVGDQYLARVYRLAAKRFHLPERDSSIERKLSTLDSIYTKLHDRRSALRLEVLEWIVIILIAFEVVMGLVSWGRH